MLQNFENADMDRFFANMANLELAITYDDVTLKSGHSKTMPDDVNTTSFFSRNIELNSSVASAAMDTVTEGKMAIAMAKAGGIGVIHKSLNIEEQGREVDSVKFHQNGLIRTPITFTPDVTLEHIMSERERRGYAFQSFPIVEDDGTLVGMVTKNDFDFSSDYTACAREVMTPIAELVTLKSGASIEDAHTLMREHRKRVIPVITDGQLGGLYLLNDVQRIASLSDSIFTTTANGQLRVAAAVGIRDYERVAHLAEKGIDAVVVDTAHGDTPAMHETIKYIKEHFPEIDVVAGNISDATSVAELIKAGADGIKVGQGPGSICTTRIIAGIGCPQLSAIYTCVKEAQQYDGTVPIIADGGLTKSGDLVKAFGAGASAVMMGSMLAGTDESPGDIVYSEGSQWKTYRGMGSIEAMKGSPASRERYQQSGKSALIAEGISGLTPYKGDVASILEQYLGGLRSGMGYVGAKDITELHEKARFQRSTPAGVTESHPHDIVGIRNAPNYKGK